MGQVGGDHEYTKDDDDIDDAIFIFGITLHNISMVSTI